MLLILSKKALFSALAICFGLVTCRPFIIKDFGASDFNHPAVALTNCHNCLPVASPEISRILSSSANFFSFLILLLTKFFAIFQFFQSSSFPVDLAKFSYYFYLLLTQCILWTVLHPCFFFLRFKFQWCMLVQYL